MDKKFKKHIIRFICVMVGALITAINMKTFVNAGGLFPGGMTGITVLIQRCAQTYLNLKLPYTPINIALNAIPAYIGFKVVGRVIHR